MQEHHGLETQWNPDTTQISIATIGMATIFWDAKGSLLVDFLPRRSTNNEEYYSGVQYSTLSLTEFYLLEQSEQVVP